MKSVKILECHVNLLEDKALRFVNAVLIRMKTNNLAGARPIVEKMEETKKDGRGGRLVAKLR